MCAHRKRKCGMPRSNVRSLIRIKLRGNSENRGRYNSINPHKENHRNRNKVAIRNHGRNMVQARAMIVAGVMITVRIASNKGR